MPMTETANLQSFGTSIPQEWKGKHDTVNLTTSTTPDARETGTGCSGTAAR